MDFLKNTFGKVKSLLSPVATNPFGLNVNLPKPQTSQYNQPAGPVKPTASQPVSTQSFNQPIGPVNRITQQNSTFTPQYDNTSINDLAYNNKFTNDFMVTPKDKVPSGAVSPSNTMSGLLGARKTLEEQFIKSLTPTDTTAKLADIRLQQVDMQQKHKKELDKFDLNQSGMGTGAFNAERQKLKDTQLEREGYLAMKEAALQGAVTLEKDAQKTIVDNMKSIATLTNSDMVGGLQTDDVTGEISAFFRDPDTGQIRQEIVGQTSPKKELTYEKIGNQLVAIDKNTGNIVNTYGGSAGGFDQDFVDNIDAYAEQYASEGTKPTAIPEGMTFGMISQRAKELPKPDGALVSTFTGVTPSSLSAEDKKSYVSTSEIVRKTLPKLIDIYPKLVTGGKLNPFTTKNRQDYETLRTEFLNKLLVARSGAAVSEAEAKRYEDMLPKNLDQLTGAGIKKLNALQEAMKTDLDNKLSSKQLSIYGYSEVDFNGEKVKVGTQVEANGMQGFVGPDGKVYTSFNSAGNASASNVPQRNNNPGNIKQGGLADKYATGVDNQGHLIFPSADIGFRAMQEDVQAKISGNSQYLPPNPTLAQLGSVYAEDPNWSLSVARILGVNPNTPTQQIPLQALTQAIARQEGFYA